MNMITPRKRVPLQDHQKAAIIHYGKAKGLTQKRIAELVGTSEKSVYRVLQEAGLLTHMPRMTSEMANVQALMRVNGVTYTDLARLITQSKTGPTRGQLVKAIVDLEDDTYLELLNEIVTARVAKSHNVGVSTAMLNIQNAVDKNAKPGNN